MCTLADIDVALACLGYGLSLSNKITILHCTTCYPPKPEEVNLRVIPFLRELKGLPVGLSDHTNGSVTAVAAVALGAVMIEKHITLDSLQDGPDHKASLGPRDFEGMVDAIRYTEKALGKRVKQPTKGELEVKDKIRRSMIESYS
jgi:N-acetylneuraminate synthase